MLQALILMCHLMTLTVQETRLSLVLRYSSNQLLCNKESGCMCSELTNGALESSILVK